MSLTVEENIAIDHAYQVLESSMSEYLDPSASAQVKKAFEMARELHIGQKRKSGEPYIIHPIEVAQILASLKLDRTTICAALLHDVLEDTCVDPKIIKEHFGEGVLGLVEGLTKISKVQFKSSQEKMAENFRKMILAMSRDIRVIIIKLADRLHNMRTLKALDPGRKTRIAEETLDIYAPLAGRLGMYKIKSELEDLCLKELKPLVYFSLAERISQKKTAREQMINDFIKGVREEILKQEIEADVVGRAKHFYSIYKKMSDKKLDFEDIYDLFAIRVLVRDVSSCYETLGVIHSIYKPIPGRFKDYIAIPKPNMYQSLHTSVMTQEGSVLEVQIRTEEMNRVAEHGVAAHWMYKDRKDKSQGTVTDQVRKMNWLKQIVNHQMELSDPNEFLAAVKVDLFDAEVYAFSPKGDLFELPVGATVLDFGFSIHSDVGLRTSGAKINGRIVPLRTEIQSGDVVEILTTQKARATKDWLSFVKTNRAKNKIRFWLRSQEREDAKDIGFSLFAGACQELGTSIEKVKSAPNLKNFQKIFNLSTFNDLLSLIGYGKINPKVAVERIMHLGHDQQSQGDILPVIRPSKKISKSAHSIIQIQGMDDIYVKTAKCCEPLPGEPIVGFISRNRGIIVHKSNCEWALLNDPARRVECSWNTAIQKSTNVRMRLTAQDKQGLLATITKVLATMKINITGLECHTDLHNRAVILLRFDVTSIEQLKDLHQKIESIDGVLYVERLTG